MAPRDTPLSFAAVLFSQLCFAGVVAAQAPAAGERKPADEQRTAQADTAQAPEAETEPAEAKRRKAAEEEIVVTGSRVRRKDLTTPAPITVITNEQVQASGKISIGDFLQSLPEQGNAINTTVNNGGNGATRVSLRGLGTSRTLVLLNGRRFVPGGNGADSSVDLNSIPTAALERVEILKDGASAVYGSDAIGGVINLITRKKMSGAEVTGYTGSSTHADGTIYNLNATTGASGERGNFLFAGGYYQQKSVFAGDRNFPGSSRPVAYSATGGRITQGSTTVPEGTFQLSASQLGRPTGNPMYNQLVTSNPNASLFIRNPDGSWRPFGSSALVEDGGDGYNFQPANYLITPQQRVSLFSTGDLRLGSSARAYVEASYVNRQSSQKLAAEPLNGGGEGITVSRDNLYNPFGTDLTDVRKRLLEFGPRGYSQDLDTFRVIGGVDGTLPDEAGPLRGWYWDVNFNFGRTEGTVVKTGNLKRSSLQQAVGPSMIIDGTPACVSRAGDPSSRIAGCVPLNLFGGPDSIPPDQITNLTFAGNLRGTNQMTSVQFNSAGELFKLLSDRPVGLAVGYEYRFMVGENIPDPITVAGDTTGNKGDITKGHYYVNEGYGELSIPIVNNLPGAESIETTAAARVFNYSNFGTDATYKLGARWSVVRDFTVRGTFSTGFRAPSISDLFLGQADGFPNVSDPCRGPAAGGGQVPQSCLAQGVPNAGTQDRSTQLRSRTGGNPDLRPETAKIYTAGIVFEPRWVRNFSMTLDYYNIRVDNSITTIGARTILAGCYPSDPSVTPNSALCANVLRDPERSYRIVNITNTFTNIGRDWTDGVDLALNYALPTEYGRFNFIFDGTWLHKFDRTLADGTVIRGRGTFDIATTGGVYPAFKFISGVRWSYRGLDLGVNTRLIGSFTECGSPAGVFNGGGLCYIDSTNNRRVSAFNTWDLFASYVFGTPAGRTTIGAGVTNLFNRSPAVIYNGFTSASDPTAYADGYLGRFFYGRVGQSF